MPTPEELAHWREMADYHDRECAYMQACCRMATREGAYAIRKLIAAIAEEREACARVAEGADIICNIVGDQAARERRATTIDTGRMIASAIRGRG